MTISEIAKALTEHYQAHRAANGGHKTKVEQYGYTSIQYKWVSPTGTVFGPFLGRGSLLRCIMAEKAAGREVVGGRALVEDIFTPKGKKVEGKPETEIKGTPVDITLTARVKKEKPVAEAQAEAPAAPAAPSEEELSAMVEEALAEDKKRSKKAKKAKVAEAPAEAPVEEPPVAVGE